jgi:predicted deacylase
MINIVSYHALQPGPRLLILGGVHGNEICGPQAISQVLACFASGAIKLQKGSVTFVPVCNPRAYAEDKRFIEHNLNRGLGPRKTPKLYEDYLMNLLCPVLEACDVLLDIHSYAAGGPAFAFRGPDAHKEKEDALAAMLGIDFLVYGWEEAYAGSSHADKNEAIGTTEYARQFGAHAVTLECGQHRDPANVAVALRAIEGALAYCGLVEGKPVMPAAMKKSRIKLTQFKDREGDFLRPLKHLETVRKGEELARYADGEVLKAPFDARLIMPKADTAMGHEWYYLAVDEA